MGKCYFCDAIANDVKYFVLNSTFLASNAYLTCNEHRENYLKFEDIYNDNVSLSDKHLRRARLANQSKAEY